MSTDSTVVRSAPRLAFLREELAIRPGRLGAMIRITVCCTLIVILCMVFRIPLPAYAAYIVFLVSGAETATTLKTAIGSAVAVTAATCLSLLMYMVDADEPALRLPLMAVATFLGMYLSRIIVIGPIAFLAGFFLVITQTLIDDVPDLDALTQLIMWLWLVITLPAVLVAIVDIVFGQSPARLLRGNVLTVLVEVEKSLRSGERTRLSRCLPITAALPELRKRAELVDGELKKIRLIDLALIEALDALVRVVMLLPCDTKIACTPLSEACRSCHEALRCKQAPSISTTSVSKDDMRRLDSYSRPVIFATMSILNRMLEGLTRRTNADPETTVLREAKAFFVADAFLNVEHVRFALKATLATMLVYFIYSGLDWPGIRTCVVTCFFVALGSVGETIHKLTLRLSGAMAGGFLGALCIVFVLPHLTDIGGLSLLTACVAFFCAWISTSSERLAYAGMQMVFAFFIGILQGYGPTEELTVLRDRVIGILLGNIMMSVVFVTVWPVSSIDLARTALEKALAALGALLREPSSSTRLVVPQTLQRARRLLSLSTFETGMFSGHSRRREHAYGLLNDLDALTAATFIVVDQPEQRAPDREWRLAASAWFENPRVPSAPVPADEPIFSALATLRTDAAMPLRAALESDLLLSSTMRSVADRAC